MRVRLAAFFLTIVTANAESAIDHCRQLLVVTTNSWAAQTGRMKVFERANDLSWGQEGPTIDVRLGRKGLAWGRGVVNINSLAGPVKREGDDRAPAGVFRLGSVFGSKAQTKMPFIPLTKNIIAVDDPASRYYNRLVDQTRIDNRDWRHAERLFGVDVYRSGILVEHNVSSKSAAGSCIFLHIWKTADTSTSGCTAMSEQSLSAIVRWLDPIKHPMLVQLPRPVYERLAKKWMLPTL